MSLEQYLAEKSRDRYFQPDTASIATEDFPDNVQAPWLDNRYNSIKSLAPSEFESLRHRPSEEFVAPFKIDFSPSTSKHSVVSASRLSAPASVAGSSADGDIIPGPIHEIIKQGWLMRKSRLMTWKSTFAILGRNISDNSVHLQLYKDPETVQPFRRLRLENHTKVEKKWNALKQRPEISIFTNGNELQLAHEDQNEVQVWFDVFAYAKDVPSKPVNIPPAKETLAQDTQFHKSLIANSQDGFSVSCEFVAAYNSDQQLKQLNTSPNQSVPPAMTEQSIHIVQDVKSTETDGQDTRFQPLLEALSHQTLEIERLRQRLIVMERQNDKHHNQLNITELRNMMSCLSDNVQKALDRQSLVSEVNKELNRFSENTSSPYDARKAEEILKKLETTSNQLLSLSDRHTSELEQLRKTCAEQDERESTLEAVFKKTLLQQKPMDIEPMLDQFEKKLVPLLTQPGTTKESLTAIGTSINSISEYLETSVDLQNQSDVFIQERLENLLALASSQLATKESVIAVRESVKALESSLHQRRTTDEGKKEIFDLLKQQQEMLQGLSKQSCSTDRIELLNQKIERLGTLVKKSTSTECLDEQLAVYQQEIMQALDQFEKEQSQSSKELVRLETTMQDLKSKLHSLPEVIEKFWKSDNQQETLSDMKEKVTSILTKMAKTDSKTNEELGNRFLELKTLLSNIQRQSTQSPQEETGNMKNTLRTLLSASEDTIRRITRVQDLIQQSDQEWRTEIRHSVRLDHEKLGLLQQAVTDIHESISQASFDKTFIAKKLNQIVSFNQDISDQLQKPSSVLQEHFVSIEKSQNTLLEDLQCLRQDLKTNDQDVNRNMKNLSEKIIHGLREGIQEEVSVVRQHVEPSMERISEELAALQQSFHSEIAVYSTSLQNLLQDRETLMKENQKLLSLQQERDQKTHDKMTASEKRLLETEAQALAAEQRVLQAKQSSSDLDIKVQQQKLKAEEYSMKIEQAQTCLAQLEERLKDSQQRFNDSEVLASNSEKKVQELEMKCDNLRRQLHDADVLLQERYDKAKEAEIQMEKRLAIIQCQFEETTKWVESTKKELEELKTECLDAERSKLKLTETVTSLNKDCNASKVKMETLSVIVHDLTVQKVKLEEAIKSLESRRSQMSDGIECIDIRVRKSQDDAENRTKQLSTSIEDQTIRLEDLKNLVIAKQNDCNELDGTRGKLKMECQMLEERYTILSSSVDQEIRRLKHATKSESADFLTGAVYDLESDMSKRLEALISQIEKLKLEKQQLTTNIHVMKSQSSQRSSMLE